MTCHRQQETSEVDLHSPVCHILLGKGMDGWCYPVPSVQAWVSPLWHGRRHQRKHRVVLLLKQTIAASAPFNVSLGPVFQETSVFSRRSGDRRVVGTHHPDLPRLKFFKCSLTMLTLTLPSSGIFQCVSLSHILRLLYAL